MSLGSKTHIQQSA